MQSPFPSPSSYTQLLHYSLSYCYSISHFVSSQNIWTHTTASGWFVTCLFITASIQFYFYFFYPLLSLYSTIRKKNFINVKVTKFMVSSRYPKIFQTSRSHLKIVDTRRATRNKFHTQDPQILGATVHQSCTPLVLPNLFTLFIRRGPYAKFPMKCGFLLVLCHIKCTHLQHNGKLS